MRPRPRGAALRALTAATVLAAAVVGTVSCSGDDAAGPTTVELAGVPPAADVGPAVEQTPFCATMLDLDASDDPSLAEVIEAYESIVDEVPRSIAPEFMVVLDRLRLLADGSDVLDVEQAQEATLDLASFVDLTCRSTTMSPLPPPTQPLVVTEPTG